MNLYTIISELTGNMPLAKRAIKKDGGSESDYYQSIVEGIDIDGGDVYISVHDADGELYIHIDSDSDSVGFGQHFTNLMEAELWLNKKMSLTR